MSRPSHSSFGFSTNIVRCVQITVIIMQFSPLSCYRKLGSNIFLSTLFLDILSLCSFSKTRDHVSHPYKLTTLSLTQTVTSNVRMVTGEWWIRLDVEGSGRGLLCGTVTAFVWGGWRKPLKYESGAGLWSEIWTWGLGKAKQRCSVAREGRAMAVRELPKAPSCYNPTRLGSDRSLAVMTHVPQKRDVVVAVTVVRLTR